MINAKQVSKFFGKRVALSNIELSVADGQMLFVTGHSGAGKTTLLRLLAGLDRPSQGKITIANLDTNELSKATSAELRRNMGIVLQNPLLLPDLNVMQNVALPLMIIGASKREIVRKVRAILEKVGLQRREGCFPQELSAGEQQRVNIARAVINKPQLLIADEPTGNLDQQASTEIFGLFRQFNQLGMTIVIASHDLMLLRSLPYHCIELSHGQLL